MPSTERRLSRVTDGAKLAGVCEGLARYLRIDPVWLRLLFLLTIPLGYASVFVYAALWLALPRRAGTEWFDDAR